MRAQHALLGCPTCSRVGLGKLLSDTSERHEIIVVERSSRIAVVSQSWLQRCPSRPSTVMPAFWAAGLFVQERATVH